MCIFYSPTPEGGRRVLSAFYFLPLLERVYQNVFYFIFLPCTFRIMLFVVVDHLFASFWYRLIVVFFLLVVVFVTTQLVCLVGCLYLGSEWFLYLLLNFVVVFCAVVCMLVSMHIDCCVISFVPSSLLSYCYKNIFHFNDHVIIAYVFIFASCCIPAWVAPPRLEHAICCVLIWVATLPPRGCYCVFFCAAVPCRLIVVTR
jgi:hypothetical protein